MPSGPSGADCMAPCAHRSYNKYRWNRFRKEYELNENAREQGTCRATRLKVNCNAKCQTFQNWDELLVEPT